MKSKQNTSLMIKAIMLLLALIIMVFIACLAWFIPPDYPVTANGLSVKTEREQGFDMAVGFETKLSGGYVMSDFAKEFDLTNISAKPTADSSGAAGTYNIFNDFIAMDLTGNGITLVRPTMKSKNTGIDTTSTSYEEPEANKAYISFDLYIRAPKACKLYLADESQAVGKVEYDGGSLVSASGEISPDAIVGAVRTAFTDYGPSNYSESDNYDDVIAQKTAPNALWIPRSDIRYDDTTVLGPHLYTRITGQYHADASYTVDGVSMNTYVHHYFYYPGDNQTGYYDTFDDAITKTITGLSKENVMICDVSHYNENDNMYYGKVLINIWIDGCDSEARRAMNGGKFRVDFEFLKVDN